MPVGVGNQAKENLIDAAFGTGGEGGETPTATTGSAVLAAGGATTAAGKTTDNLARAGDREVANPEASRNVARDAERAVPGDDPDVDPDQAFREAERILEQRTGAAIPAVDVPGLADDVSLLLVLAVLGAGYVGYQRMEG